MEWTESYKMGGGDWLKEGKGLDKEPMCMTHGHNHTQCAY